MKKVIILIILFIGLLLSAPMYAVLGPVPSSTTANAEKEVKEDAVKDWNKLSKKEKRAERKKMRKALKKSIKEAKRSGADSQTLLLVILAILLPPLAMALYDGISNRFWISLLLTLLGYLPGIIYTLVVILGGR